MTANDTDDDDWMANFVRRRMGQPQLLHDGRTVPQSLVHLATEAMPAIAAERDRAHAALADVSPEYVEIKERYDKALARYQAAVFQLCEIQKFKRGMEGLT